MAVRKKIDIPFDIPFSIVLDESFPYSSTALSAEGIAFIRTDENPWWVIILCTVKKEKTTNATSM